MAYARSCIHASIHVASLQTLIISVIVLLASMLVAVALAAEPPSGYRFELTHVDAQGNFTKDELIRRAADRSRLRGSRRAAATTSAALLGANKPSNGASTSYRSMVHFSESEYLMEVDIRGQTYQAIADTGSNLIWMKPRKPMSSNQCLHPLPCDDDLCASLPAALPCVSGDGGCSYHEKYGDGFRTSGRMCRETLSFLLPGASNITSVVDDIALGWSNETNCAEKHPNCDLKNYNGTVGLGLGKQSLVKQLGVDSFSYCLTSYDNNKLKSPLLLGSLAAIKDSSTSRDSRSEVQTTPLLPNKDRPFRYYVHLEYIEIGGNRTYLPTPKPKEDATGSLPNMFIDSGTSFTILEKTAHKALLEHVNKEMHQKGKKNGTTFCWPGIKDLPRMPDLELHFTGSAVMYIHKDKIMYVDDGTQVCLAIEVDDSDDSGVSVLGNYQQQNIHMHFDVTKNKMSFVKVEDCSKL